MFADFFRLSWETTTSQSVVVLVCVPCVVPLDYYIGYVAFGDFQVFSLAQRCT